MAYEWPRKRAKLLSLATLVLALVALACGETAAPTSQPTDTPTRTPRPTNIPRKTDIPQLADTPAATDTPTLEPQPTAERVEAQVVEVVDGDTIKVEMEGQIYSVRYIGIDKPETVHPSEPVGWMGPEASAANEELVGGQTVYLEKDVSETDQYGRLLRYVFLADGLFVNAELVRLGYAQVSTYPPDVRYQEDLLEIQQEARESERGLWGPTPTPVLPTVTPLPPTATPIPPTATPAPVVQPTQPPPTEPPPPLTEAPSAPGNVIIS
jgi:endonuclease YncB( thermonuclease family)